MSEQTVVGIDVAAARPCTAVAVRTGRAARAVDWLEFEVGEGRGWAAPFVAWVERQGPAVVAVDAPQGYKLGARGGAAAGSAAASPASRVCDRELLRRRISVYQVPARQVVAAGEARLPSWIAAGFEIFKALRRVGFEIPAQWAMPGALGQPPALLEVYPHASFVTLLGGRPAPKLTRSGAHTRVLALRHEHVEWDEYFDHDSLDALAAALTAWRYLQGQACAVGDGREGLIWLPVPEDRLLDSYSRLAARIQGADHS